MPARVSRSSTPNSRSRRRSSTSRSTRPHAGGLAARCARSRRARTYGERGTRSGARPLAGTRTSAPTAAACRSPSSDSGTSMSRCAMSMRASPPASAASRATLPALCPWRSSHRVLGHSSAMPRRGTRARSGPHAPTDPPRRVELEWIPHLCARGHPAPAARRTARARATPRPRIPAVISALLPLLSVALTVGVLVFLTVGTSPPAGPDATTVARMPAERPPRRGLPRAPRPGRPFVLPNAWDAASARTLAALPATAALGTTSAGIAWSLGRPDGELDRDAMLEVVARVAAAVDVPVTADVEAGYGDVAATVAGGARGRRGRREPRGRHRRPGRAAAAGRRARRDRRGRPRGGGRRGRAAVRQRPHRRLVGRRRRAGRAAGARHRARPPLRRRRRGRRVRARRCVDAETIGALAAASARRSTCWRARACRRWPSSPPSASRASRPARGTYRAALAGRPRRAVARLTGDEAPAARALRRRRSGRCGRLAAGPAAAASTSPSSRGSTLPPVTMAITGPGPGVTRPASSAATAAAPAGSATTLTRSGEHAHGLAQLVVLDQHDLVHQAGQVLELQVAGDGRGQAVGDGRHRRAAAPARPPPAPRLTLGAPTGSTPTTRAVLPRARSAAATPSSSPPPPTGTTTVAASGRSSASSSPRVPWPGRDEHVVVRVHQHEPALGADALHGREGVERRRALADRLARRRPAPRRA